MSQAQLFLEYVYAEVHIINNDDALNREINHCEVVVSTYVDKNASKYYDNWQIDKMPVKFLWDAGATCNIIPLTTIKELSLTNKIKANHGTLHAFIRYKIKTVEIITLLCNRQDRKY